MDRKPRAEGGPYIGRPMPRFEDLRLVRGAGKYSDDISMPEQAVAAFVRSPHAHARVKRIDASAARKMPGVVAVLTGADYVADGLKGAIQRANPAGAIDIKVRAFAQRNARFWRSHSIRWRSTACAIRAKRSRWWSQKHCSRHATPPKRSKSNTRCSARSPT